MSTVDDLLRTRLLEIAKDPGWSIPYRFEAKAIADGQLTLHVGPVSLSDRDIRNCLTANIHHRLGEPVEDVVDETPALRERAARLRAHPGQAG